MSLSKFTSKFSAADIKPLMLPRSVLEEAKSSDHAPMGNFHAGFVLEKDLEVKQYGRLLVKQTEDHAQKMFAFVVDQANGQAVLSFSRKGPTNFAESQIELAGLKLSCSEQVFMMLKASIFYGVSSNYNETLLTILRAAEPRFAKKAGRDLKDVDTAHLDAMSPAAMFTTLLIICTNSGTFQRYKWFAHQLATFGRESGINSCLVIESGGDDMRWGYSGFTQQFLKAVSSSADTGLDLFSAVKEVSVGENLLGLILTEFFNGIRDMEYPLYPAYMEAVSGIDFVRVVE